MIDGLLALLNDALVAIMNDALIAIAFISITVVPTILFIHIYLEKRANRRAREKIEGQV